MTPLEAEALLIRYQAAWPHVDRADEDGRWELLAEIVDPSPALERASLQAAAERRPSKLAQAMVGAAKDQVREVRERRRWLSDSRDLGAAAETEPACPVAA